MRITGPPLHEAQQIVQEAPHRFKVLAAGRRWGKDFLGVSESLKTAVQGGRAWWICPTFPLGMIGWRVFKSLAFQIMIARVREADKMIEFPNGGWAQVKSADDPDSLRGEGLDLAVINEAAFIKKFEETWAMALRPALSDRQGDAIFLSTPFGYNHFFDLFKKADGDPSALGFAGGNGEWGAWRYPTIYNPYIRPEEVEAAKETLPGLVFRQEYMAEFVQLAGALVRRLWITDNLIDEAPKGRYIRAWDLAASLKTTADFTCGTKMAFIDGDLIIADVVHGRWEWPQAIKVIGQTARMDTNAVRQGIEIAGIQRAMLDLLHNEPSLVGIPFTGIKSKGDKLTRFMPFVARAEQGKVKFVRGAWNQKAIDEVCAFPSGTHDDIPDSMGLGCQMLPMVTRPLVTLI